MSIVEKFMSYITGQGLALAPDGMLAEREAWINGLSETDALELLRWAEYKNEYHSDSFKLGIIQEAIQISADVGRRLQSTRIRQQIESLFAIPALATLALEGVEIIGSSDSIPFLSRVFTSTDKTDILFAAVDALGAIGGEHSLDLLRQIKQKNLFVEAHKQQHLEAVIAEVETGKS